MLPHSKTMRMADFEELQPHLGTVDHVLSLLDGGDKAQHRLRRWEYAMALRAFTAWQDECRPQDLVRVFRVADHGCCTGMLAPAMFWMGHDVTMYEIWAWGNQQEYATAQMEMVRPHALPIGVYRWVNRPLGGLLDEDRGMDVVYCISTLEHIPDYEGAFRDLCRCVGPRGLLFITSDSAEDEQDHYVANNVRGGRMFNKDVYERLARWGLEEGLVLLGGVADWSWDESCRLVNDYGFACLSMVRL